MKKVTISDSLFMPYGKSAHMLGDNTEVKPSNFEWELTDAKIARFVTESYMREANGPGQVAWICEPFFLHPQNYLDVMNKKFDYVLTHNDYFAKNMGWLWHPFGGSMITLADWGLKGKTKNVSMLLSYKKSQLGHQLRHEIVNRYADKFEDIFGLVAWDRKIDALAPYRFAVIIETERSPYYFSEKLIDCLSVGTIPIYWGCPNIDEFFDPKGIIQVDDIEQIGAYLDLIGPKFYESRLDNIKTNFDLAKTYRIAEDWIYNKYPFLFE